MYDDIAAIGISIFVISFLCCVWLCICCTDDQDSKESNDVEEESESPEESAEITRIPLRVNPPMEMLMPVPSSNVGWSLSGPGSHPMAPYPPIGSQCPYSPQAPYPPQNSASAECLYPPQNQCPYPPQRLGNSQPTISQNANVAAPSTPCGDSPPTYEEAMINLKEKNEYIAPPVPPRLSLTQPSTQQNMGSCETMV